MRKILFAVAGVLVMNEIIGLKKIHSSYIGKIIDSKPRTGSPCIDGTFSTNLPNNGVCSWHGGIGVSADKKDKFDIEKAKFIKRARNLIIHYPELEKEFDRYKERRRWAEGETVALLDEKLDKIIKAMRLQADQGAKHLNMHVNDYLYLLDIYQNDGSVALNKELENIYNGNI